MQEIYRQGIFDCRFIQGSKYFVETIMNRKIKFVSKWVYFFCVWVLVATAVSCQSNRIHSKPVSLQLSNATNGTTFNKDNVGKEISIDGLYYGTEEINGFQFAIVFRLEKNGGFLYESSNFLQIFELEVKTPNLIKFKLGRKPDDLVQIFEGDFDSEHITGKFRTFSTDVGNRNDNRKEGIHDSNSDRKKDFRDSDAEREQVRFQKLEISPSPFGCGGLYSNKEYIEESGDVYGDEMLLIPTSRNVFGAFSYDGGEISYSFITSIQDNTFEFEITTSGVKRKFSGTCSQNKVKISYVSEGADIKAEPRVLLKNRELNDFLTELPKS